jgi:hypothetical protein
MARNGSEHTFDTSSTMSMLAAIVKNSPIFSRIRCADSTLLRDL